MKHKIFALFAVCLLTLNAVGAVFADTKTNKTKKQTNGLVSLLPASDGVMTVDLKSLFSNGLPQILSGNQTMLGDVNNVIDKIKTDTGIDLRQFDQLAVGVTAEKVSASEYDFKPVALARGNYNAASLISVVKLASKGQYREEKIGGKTVYVFSAKDVAAKNKPDTNNSMIEKAIDRMIDGLTKEIAVTSLDAKTLAFGTLPRVRQTIENKTSAASEVTDLIKRNPNSMMSFAGKVPNGMSAFLPLDNDELGKSIDSIRYVYGTMSVAGENTNVQLMAKTEASAQAEELYSTLEGLQLVGKTLIGGLKGADKQVYARMIENAVIKRSANEVSLDLSVPQNDINVLIGGKK